jgi:hypothetical protein
VHRLHAEVLVGELLVAIEAVLLDELRAWRLPFQAPGQRERRERQQNAPNRPMYGRSGRGRLLPGTRAFVES